MENIEIVLIVVFVIGYGIYKITRYATFEEAEKKRLQEKVDELTARLVSLEHGNDSRLDGRTLEFAENIGFLIASAVRLRGYSRKQENEVDEKLAMALEEFAEWRGLDKDYKNGPRSK